MNTTRTIVKSPQGENIHLFITVFKELDDHLESAILTGSTLFVDSDTWRSIVENPTGLTDVLNKSIKPANQKEFQKAMHLE